jgi:hypothetical protein
MRLHEGEPRGEASRIAEASRRDRLERFRARLLHYGLATAVLLAAGAGFIPLGVRLNRQRKAALSSAGAPAPAPPVAGAPMR